MVEHVLRELAPPQFTLQGFGAAQAAGVILDAGLFDRPPQLARRQLAEVQMR